MTVEEIRNLINKQVGKGSIASSIQEHVDVIPTGIIGIDRLTGIGGIPRGRITEIYGEYSSGKSTLALHIVTQCQKLGYVAAYIDAEHALDSLYAQALGVNMDDLLISQPDHGEHAFEVVETLIRTGDVQCIIIDSVASLVPLAELEGEITQQFVGLQARLISKAMRKLIAVTSKSNTALIFLNQLRENAGMTWGNPIVTPGGRALKFYSSLRMELKRDQAINVGQIQEGFACKVKIVKNKLSIPYRETLVPILYGTGFDSVASLVAECISAGLIQKSTSSSWLTMEDGTKLQGTNQAKVYLLENPEVAEGLRCKL